ncbi:MAG TPA: acetate--CoA ligase family protein [archaeon]|nr:acetate--CoA ligase family protein [archaeon]
MKKLGDKEAFALLKEARVPLVKHAFAKTPALAAEASKRIGYPCVLKASSPALIHKTEVGAVILNLAGPGDVIRAAALIQQSVKKALPKARIEGWLVQEQVRGKSVRELIVGSKNDPQFGHVLVVGLGGIFAEALNDVSLRLIPVTPADIAAMLDELKGAALLGPARGMKPVNRKALIAFIAAVSRFAERAKRVQELDLNPVFADDQRVVAADVRVIVE